MRRLILVFLALLMLALVLLYYGFRPETITPLRAEVIESVMQQAIRDKKMPGAVVLVGHRGRVVYRRAFGQRALEPKPELMTVDTIFDVSSLTKLVATATSVMILVDRGQLQLSDPIAKYLPEMRDPVARKISIEQMLTHTSGFDRQLDLERPWEGREGALKELLGQPALDRPGTRFRYSDINYIALGFVIERITDRNLASFASENIFAPLGIEATTCFCPAQTVVPIAPTQWRRGKMLRGTVHGPQAERMGGIAGNGGLFSRADDLARYCQMILDGGQWQGKRILSPATVARMTSPIVVSSGGATRGLGWDIDSSLSTSRGEYFPLGSFGHTGYAGVSLWIDPASQTYVIFMSNMVHPDGKGDVKSVRSRLFSVVASSIFDVEPATFTDCERTYAARVSAGLAAFQEGQPAATVPPSPPLPQSRVLNGVDVLWQEHFQRLTGKKVGLLSNRSGLSLLGTSTAELLTQGGASVRLLANDGDLQGLDTVVLDMQACGTRFDSEYARLPGVLQQAARHKVRVVLLDRPNPLDGETLEGPVAKPYGFRGQIEALPVRHGMTLGELALLLNQECHLGAELQVIPMDSWLRSFVFDQTEQSWVAASDDLNDLNAIWLRPGIGPLASTNLSVGMGTPTPYQWLGAPWVNGPALAHFLNQQSIPGVRFVAGNQRPTAPPYRGKNCGGVHVLVVDRAKVRSLFLGLELGCALHRLYPRRWHWDSWVLQFGDPVTLKMLKNNEDPAKIEQSWQTQLEEFRRKRTPYLIYRLDAK